MLKCKQMSPVIGWSLVAGHCVSWVVSFPWSHARCEQAHFHFSSPKEFAFWLIKASFFLATPGSHVTSQKLQERMPDGHL